MLTGGIWIYAPDRIYCQQRGAGNNWANGYRSCLPACEAVLEMLHAEVDKCEHFGGFLVLMSVAGGTGSGLGTRVTEALREHFPHAFIINQGMSILHTSREYINFNLTP